MDRITSIFLCWKFRPNRQGRTNDTELQVLDSEKAVSFSPIENYPSGYPQYSALISSYDFFFTFRSFRRLRSRALLVKQDELNVLEAQLDQLDREEARPFFLGTCRQDRNADRKDILNQIHLKLSEYDTFVDRCRQMLSYGRANTRDIASLQNWLERRGCVHEDETLYLDQADELVSLASSSDLAMKQIEDWIEDKLIRYYNGFRAYPGFGVSINSDVYIYSGSLIKYIARVIMLFLITFLLLAPVVICMLVHNIPARIFIIIMFTAIYLMALSHLTRTKMIELTMAGATFATMLTVFVASSSNS